ATPRVSFRGSAGWSQPSIKGSPIDKLREIPIQLDVNYNWEGGKWHPFVGAGLRARVLQYKKRGGAAWGSGTKLCVDLGAGIEYFFNRTLTFKGEGRYEHVDETGRIDPSGVTFSAGLKTYF